MLQGTQPVSRDGIGNGSGIGNGNGNGSGSGGSGSSNREIEMVPLSPIEEQSAEGIPNPQVEVVLPSQLDGVNTVRMR